VVCKTHTHICTGIRKKFYNGIPSVTVWRNVTKTVILRGVQTISLQGVEQ
jgi:hypothetical protein